MNRKLAWGAMLLFSVCLLALSSCSDDDKDGIPAKPLITLDELGSGHDSPNDRIAYIGTDVHIEATIVAEGLIKQIEVEVHQEDGSYKFEKIYTDSKYVGAKNTTLHEHLDIPSDAVAGEYHLHLTVTDQFGQSTTVEAELTIEEAPSNQE
ncbi:MAG: DUF4625 domain-containing protein [Dysgonomonas sp.]